MFSEGQKPFVEKDHLYGLLFVHSLIYFRLFVLFLFGGGGSHAATEGSSEFSASDLDIRCRRSYRSRKQEVNYCETSDSDGSQASTNKDKKKKRRRLSSSNSEGQCRLHQCIFTAQGSIIIQFCLLTDRGFLIDGSYI